VLDPDAATEMSAGHGAGVPTFPLGSLWNEQLQLEAAHLHQAGGGLVICSRARGFTTLRVPAKAGGTFIMRGGAW